MMFTNVTWTSLCVQICIIHEYDTNLKSCQILKHTIGNIHPFTNRMKLIPLTVTD